MNLARAVRISGNGGQEGRHLAKIMRCVLTPGMAPGIAGLAVSYALSVTQSLNWMVRMSAGRTGEVGTMYKYIFYFIRDSIMIETSA